MFFLILTITANLFYIKHQKNEEYLTGSFNPISLPTYGPKMFGHLFQIAHPENDSKITIFKLACVPGISVIPDVVLDATREQDKLTYFEFKENLKNEEFNVIRYREGVLIVRDEECLTYNREKGFFYTMRCIPEHEEQIFDIVPGVCSNEFTKIPLAAFTQQNDFGILPLLKKLFSGI